MNLNSAGDTVSKASSRKRVNESNEECNMKKQKGMATDNTLGSQSGMAEAGGSQPRRSL